MWPIIKIEVQDETVKFQTTEADRHGETRDLPYQNVFVHLHGQPYPSKQKAFIPKDQYEQQGNKRIPRPFPKGWYQCDMSRAFIGYGKVSLALGQMIPAPQQQQKPAQAA